MSNSNKNVLTICIVCEIACNDEKKKSTMFKKCTLCEECETRLEEGTITTYDNSDFSYPHPEYACSCDIYTLGGCHICSGNCHTKDSHGQVSCMFNYSMGIKMEKNDWCPECIKWQAMRGWHRQTGWFPYQWDYYEEKHEFFIFEAAIQKLYPDDALIYDASFIRSEIDKDRKKYVDLAQELIKSRQLGWNTPDEYCEEDGQIWSRRDDITREHFHDYDEIYSFIALGCGPKLALESVNKESLWIELIIRDILQLSGKFYYEDGNPDDVIKCAPFEESVPQTQEEIDNDETHVGFLVNSSSRSEKWKELFGKWNTWDAVKMIQEGFYEEEKEHLIALGFMDPAYDKIIE